jgi:hypothetical protein
MGTRIVVVIFEVNVLADAYRRVSIVTLVTVGPSQFAHFVLLVLVFLIQGLSLSLYIIYHNPVTVSTTILIIFLRAVLAHKRGARRTVGVPRYSKQQRQHKITA